MAPQYISDGFRAGKFIIDKENILNAFLDGKIE